MARAALDRIFYRTFNFYDGLWRSLHRVREVDQLISLSVVTWKGGQKPLGNTTISRGDRLVQLHLNHSGFSGGGTTRKGKSLGQALAFRRKLFGSMNRLAGMIERDPAMRDVKALYGVTWFPPHGDKVGFIVERLPDSWTVRLQKIHFRLLLKAFFPALAKRENIRLHPHVYWMTRGDLLGNFAEQAGETT